MPDPLWINVAPTGGAPSYTATELRQAMTLPVSYDGRAMGGRAGVRPGGTQLNVTFANPTLTVAPGVAYLDHTGFATTRGGYWVAIPSAEAHTAQAADGTNPRKDIVILRVYDHDEDASGLRFGRTEYVVGTPAGSPVEPAVPTGAFKLATLDVPNTGGGGLGSAVVTINFPFTVAAGGVLPLRSATEESALSGPHTGLVVYRRDTGLLRVKDASAFRDLGEVVVCTSSTRPAHSNGRIIYETDTKNLLRSDGSTWDNPDNVPRGILAFVKRTTNFNFTTEATLVTAPSVTLVSGRRYRVSFCFRSATSDTANDIAVLRIKEGATQYQEVATGLLSTSGKGGSEMFVTLDCTADITAGSKTFIVTATRVAGSGTCTIENASGRPCELTVEDVGSTTP